MRAVFTLLTHLSCVDCPCAESRGAGAPGHKLSGLGCQGVGLARMELTNEARSGWLFQFVQLPSAADYYNGEVEE